MKTLLLLALAVVVLFPACLWATPAKPALEVVVLGSGGPRAFGRAGSIYILLVDRTPRFLLDAGPGAFLPIGEFRLDLQKVKTVLLNHLHIDNTPHLPPFFHAQPLPPAHP